MSSDNEIELGQRSASYESDSFNKNPVKLVKHQMFF